MASPALAITDTAKKDTVNLGEITVKGQGLHRNDLPTTVNVVPAEEFEDRIGVRIEEILNEIPGIYVRALKKGGVASSIEMRGFTSGAHGGDIGIFVDGIPLNEGESHSDGYADMNILIPLEIERLEVFKGPSSALYGNFGRGGVLAFTTKHTGEYNKIQMEYGSYKTADIQGAFGFKFDDSLQNNTAVELFRTDDYRDHSEWSRLNASTRFTYDVSDKLDLGLSFRAHQSSWDASNNIPQYMYDDEELRSSFPDYCQDDGGDKKVFIERFDLGYNISNQLRLLYWAYGIQQDFTRFQSRTDGSQKEYFYDRRVLGTGLSLNMDYMLADRSLTAVVGAEVYDEITDTDVWNTTDRHRDSRAQRRNFDIVTYSLFGQAEYELSRYFRPMVGFRYDTFGGSFDNNDPGTTAYSSDINDFQKLSPKLGFRSMLLENLDFRASYSEGFALPRSEVKFDTDVQVDPMVITQYEMGLNYQIPGLLWVDVAGFILDTDDEIQENPVDSGIYDNIGSTRRQGLEAGVRVYPLQGLEIYGNLTLMNTEVIENPDSSLEGKEVSRVPEYTANLGAKYTAPNGMGGRINWRKTGEYYLDSANTQTYDGYDRVDAGIFYTLKGDAGRSYRLSFSVENLLDETYADSVSYSSGTFWYAPGWPRSYWFGLTMDF
jgi:outer membrane receptor protein involved in Fe transport